MGDDGTSRSHDRSTTRERIAAARADLSPAGGAGLLRRRRRKAVFAPSHGAVARAGHVVRSATRRRPHRVRNPSRRDDLRARGLRCRRHEFDRAHDARPAWLWCASGGAVRAQPTDGRLRPRTGRRGGCARRVSVVGHYVRLRNERYRRRRISDRRRRGCDHHRSPFARWTAAGCVCRLQSAPRRVVGGGPGSGGGRRGVQDRDGAMRCDGCFPDACAAATGSGGPRDNRRRCPPARREPGDGALRSQAAGRDHPSGFARAHSLLRT